MGLSQDHWPPAGLYREAQRRDHGGSFCISKALPGEGATLRGVESRALYGAVPAPDAAKAEKCR